MSFSWHICGTSNIPFTRIRSGRSAGPLHAVVSLASYKVVSSLGFGELYPFLA